LNGSNTFVGFVQALLAANVPSVAAEAYDDHGGVEPIPQRGAAVAPVRGDSALSKDVSTVDDGEVTQGQVSEVIALEAIVGGTVGHYGYGQGASGGPLPIHSP
jgi:hypothetical protein